MRSTDRLAALGFAAAVGAGSTCDLLLATADEVRAHPAALCADGAPRAAARRIAGS